MAAEVAVAAVERVKMVADVVVAADAAIPKAILKAAKQVVVAMAKEEAAVVTKITN